jgi:hypothetical protein
MKLRNKWVYGMASAAVMALVVTLNSVGTVGKTNNVNAMEQFLKGVKAADGAAQVKESDTNGKAVTKSKVKLLADKSRAAKSLTADDKSSGKVIVDVDLEVEKGDQKNADAGSSPWKLDPVFVSQVFVSLKVSPEGIQGNYPVKYEELKLVKSTGKEAVVEVSGKKTTIAKVYLKRLIKQDKTGIWTVIGYDPINNK